MSSLTRRGLLGDLPRLALIVGPAGIGKTQFLLENFSRFLKEAKNPFERDILYLLPTAEHRERIVDLVLRRDHAGFWGERVLTLNHLMQELLVVGARHASPLKFATDAQRRFLLSEIVGQKAGNYFSQVADLKGFLEKTSEFVGELKEWMISISAFRKGVTKLVKFRPEIQEKYQGLLAIYESYEARLEELGLRDQRDGLFLLKERENGKGRGSPHFKILFVDGFFDFSKSQLEFLNWLAQRSDQVVLALTLDLSGKRRSLFEIPLQTLTELEQRGFEIVDLSKRENQRAMPEELRHVERNLFRPSPSVIARSPANSIGGTTKQSTSLEIASGTSCPRNDEVILNDSLLILEATGVRGEMEMIAREIRRLVKTGRYYYSDLAVILRRIGSYEGILRSVFREFDIPFEIHERERLRDAPLARTLVSFFKILLEDWKREDLFNFLKSSYVEADYAEVCSLEIRAFTLGIAQGRERWLSEIGGPLLEKLRVFQERSEKEKTVGEWIRFTQEILRSFGLDQIPLVYDETSRRDFASLKRIENLLEEIRRTNLSWKTSEKSFEVFSRELLGLVEIDLFSLHERDKNRVQVYDISLARQKEYKVTFLAGLLEKQFPVEIREDPILSDEERRVIGLPEKLPRQALERYFFYLGCTRARERLILSYPRFDLEGHEALPSFYVDEVRSLFEEPLPIRSYPVSQPLPRLEDAVEEREVEAHLVRRLFQKTGGEDHKGRTLTLALYNRFLERDSFRALVGRILFEPAARIESEKIRSAFLPKGGIFRPTGLEIYGRCPYRYFASVVLDLEEQEEGIDAKQVGILLHDCLEHYWRERMEKQRKDLEEIENAKHFVRSRLHDLLKESPLQGERAYRIKLKVAQMEEWLARMVEKEIQEGGPMPGFFPRYLELQFGFDPKGPGHLKLYDSYREDLLLRGKIDRVDLDKSGRYALVIDYKTGGSFKNEDLDFGISLQLPLYLLAVQQLLKLKPLGGMIYQINSAKSSGFFCREALEESQAETRSRAVFGEKEFKKVLERTIRFSRRYAEGIKQAEIPVRPRDCDTYCPYSSVCRIEKWRLPFIYQEIREEDAKQ